MSVEYNLIKPRRKTRRVFADFLNSFEKHPGTNDIVEIQNEDAIEQSVKNLIMTRKGERYFHPEIGCEVYSSLFENIGPLTAINIKRSIEEVLLNFESRITLEEVEVKPNLDYNGYDIVIKYYIINNSVMTKVDYFLERIR